MRKFGITGFIFCFGLIFLSCSEDKTKTVYVENGKLYNEFTMSKELGGQLEQLVNSRKTMLDSMKLQLELSSKELQIKGKDVTQDEYNSFEIKRQNFIVKERTFNEEHQRLQETYNGQIWERLNKYVQDFGKEMKYEYILGGNGDGSLMYSNEENNITDELIKFCNKEYAGN